MKNRRRELRRGSTNFLSRISTKKFNRASSSYFSPLSFNVDKAKQQKQKLKNFVLNLNEQYKQGRLTYLEYENKLNRTLKHKTPEHWLNYYDSYIKRHEEKTIAIKTRRFEPRQEFNPKPFLIILAIAIISVLALTVLLNPSIRYAITGFVTETLGEPAPTEPLPENITNETTPEIPEIPINETPEEPINITPEIPINETNETQEIPIVPEAQPPSNGTNETKDCFELLKTQSGRYYCKDDDTFYFCDNIEYVEQVEEGDVFRCIGYIESKDKVSKEDCPFDHPDCEITVDNKKGWGPAQVDEKVDYKLSTFHYNFYCSEGHCEIPFYFKSKTPLNGNLAFDATAHLELRNIAVERVLQGGLKEEGNKRVSMQKEDSYYYILSFDFTPELIGSEEGIHKNKPLKFNITVSLDGEKILELDPVGQTDSNAGGALDCDSGGADPTLTLSCAIGDIVVVGVSYEDSGAATSITFTGAPGGFTKLSELNNANLDIEFWNATCTAAVSGATLTAVGAASGSNDECSVVASVYSGARDLNKTVRTTDVAAADPSIAVTGMLSTNGGDWVVDVFGSDIDLTGATGQNVVVNGVDTENAVVYISDCSYLEGGSDGSCTMSWDGSTNEGQIATHIWGGADTSKPNTVAFVTPTLANASKTNRNWIFINASVADDAAISTCIIDWNGTNQTTYMTKVGSGTNVSCWINMTSLPDGNFTFKVHANDTTNNFNMSIYRTIFLDSTGPVIASAKINATTPQVVGRRVKVNASINSGASNVTLTVIPPSGTAYNTSVLKNGNEYYNETIKLDVSGKWQFKFWANDTFGNNATPVFAQDLGNNYYINASNGPQFKDYNKNATNVGAGKFIKFNLTVTDGDGISFVNGTVNGVASVFSLVSGSEWMYQWGPCISSDAKVDFSFVSGNDTMGVWNSSTVTGVESVCDVDGPTIGNAKANATTIGLNEYFCVNATVSDTAGVSTVYANIWNTTEFNNLTMTDLGTSSCDVGSGDGVYGVDIQGTKAGYWNYTRVYANDSVDNWATYTITGNLTINVTTFDDVIFNSNFEMGNLVNQTYLGGNITWRYYNATVNYSTIYFADKHWWFYYSVENIAGKNVQVNITNIAEVDDTGDRWANIEPVYSYDNETWFRIPLRNRTFTSADNVFSVTITTNGSSKIYVAPIPPYTNERVNNLAIEFQDSPLLNVTRVGVSPLLNLNITKFIITNSSYPDANKFKIYIIGQVHSGETGDDWFIEGMIRFLLSDNATAAKLTRDYIFHIVPILNVEGVYTGTSRYPPIRFNNQTDLNRVWNAAIINWTTDKEVNATFTDINNTMPDMFLDVHSSVNNESNVLNHTDKYFLYAYGGNANLSNFMNNESLFWKNTTLGATGTSLGSCSGVTKRIFGPAGSGKGYNISTMIEHPHDNISRAAGEGVDHNPQNTTDWKQWGENFALGIFSYFRTQNITMLEYDGPTISDEGYNETSISLNKYFCVNITVTDVSGVSTVYANIWNTTEFNNLTMTDLGTTACDVGSGDNVYGVDIQGTKAGYWNYTRVYANDTQNNWATYALTNNITINVSIANVVWNQTTLNMGNVASGTSRIKNVTVTASEDNLNVKAVWTGGNGTFINATPYLIGDLNSGSTYEVEINCSPSSAQDVGTYYANFTVNSTENSTGSNLEVNCSVIEIDTTFPLINFVFPSPNNNTITGNLSVPYTINFTEKNLDKFDWEINGTNYTFYNQSLVLMLDFDNISDLGEVSGIIKDVSNYSKTGTLNGTTYLPNFAAGKYGLGLNLSDNSAWNQYARINADDALNLRDAVTIETWIYPRSFDLVSPYISGLVIRKGSGGGDQWELRLGDSDIPTGNRIQFILAGGTKLYSDTYLQANQWYHIVGTWNISDTKMRMFINGVEQPTTAVQGTRLNDLPDGFVEIGRDAETGDRTFNGVIDEVRVYNRSLTSQEVWQHFMSNLKKYDANNWTFYTNQSNLTASTYTYRASALDTSGNYNSTLLRTLTTTGQLCGCWNGTKNYICGDTVYESCTMNCNLNTSDTCFTVGADHLIIEGAGYKLMDNNKGGTSSGLYLQYDVNTTVKNFYIINFSNGINLAQAYNNTLENNTFYNNTQGIFVESSAKNKILNSTFVNNTRGIEFATHSSSNLVRYSSLLNDTISIYVYSLGSTPGADLANNTIQDTRLNSTSGSFDFSSAPGGNANANFTLLNTSFDPAKVSVTVGDAVVANVVYSKWYVDVVTNYSSGDKLPATGGTASIYDNSSNLKLSDTVESTSFITRQNVTEFYQTSEGSYYQSNYSINATKGQDYSQTESVNVTWNNLGTDKIQLYLEISCGCNNQTYNYTCGQTVYESCTLNCNINATGNCLTAGADNIILDGAGYKIMGANTGNGIIDTAYLNVTIKNFFISNFTNGLDFENTASSNSTIYNNTITNSSYGVYSIDSNNNLFSLNIIKYNNYGIYLTATEAGTVNNTVMNSVITENNYGIYFYTGIDAKSPYPFITSNIVRDSNVTSYVNDTVSKVSEANNIHNNTLLNVTGNPYNISLSDGGANSALYVQYYVDVATNYSNESAGTTGTVKVYDVTNALALTDTIESTSLITRQNVSEYLAVASGKTYLTNYSFNATRNDDISDTQSANITGNKIDSNKIQLTLTVSNTAPEIEYVSSIPNTNPIESNASAITFSFTAYDAQHVADLDAATIKVNLSVSGNLVNVSHYNTTCVDAGNIDADRENFSCAVDLWYWEPDTIWNVTINISDDSALESTNSSTQFNYNTLTAIKIGPASVSFAGATAGSSNTTASSAILVNNTGNDDDKILAVNASSLYNSSALTIPASKYLGAENFTVDIETGAAKPECDIGGSAFSLSNSTYVSITGSSLLRGNNTKNEGQRNLYYCLANVSSALPVGTYDTTLQGPWWIKILLVAVVPAETLRRLRKKKNKGEKLTKENLIEVLDERLKPLQDTLNQIAETIKEEVIKVPISIFEKDKKLGPAESLVKYLKENLGMKFSEIAKLLKRDQRTIWLTYSNAKEKKKEPNIIKETEIKIPLNIIANRKLSILESVVMHLFGKGMKKNEIAELLGRDIRVIYTIYSRAKNKLEK